MRTKKTFFIALFIFAGRLMFSQGNEWNVYNRATQQWTNYNTDNSGITDDVVVEIKIDPFGNKWMCTNEGGLVEFKRNGIASGISKFSTQNAEIKIYPNPFG